MLLLLCSYAVLNPLLSPDTDVTDHCMADELFQLTQTKTEMKKKDFYKKKTKWKLK